MCALFHVNEACMHYSQMLCNALRYKCMHGTLDYLDSSVILYNTSNWEIGTLCMLNVWCGTLVYQIALMFSTN